MLGTWNSGIFVTENLLINGKGRLSVGEFMNNNKYNLSGLLKTNAFEENHWNKLPVSTFFVTRVMKYRFRVAYYSFDVCPIVVSIEEHDMLIIASDSSPIKPKRVKSFIIHSGERYRSKNISIKHFQ